VTVSSSKGKRLSLAWIVVVAITVIYLAIDHTADEHGRPVSSTAVTVLAIALGLVKYRVILREFMDVRGAPAVLRRLTDLLVVVIAVALLGTYVIGRAVA
jgi:hypothetical protein